MPTLLTVGRNREVEFRIDLHSPVTGDVLSLAVIGSPAELGQHRGAGVREGADRRFQLAHPLHPHRAGLEIESMSREEMLSDDFQNVLALTANK